MRRTFNKGLRLKILLVPEYASFGGTRSFFFKLLGIHQKNGFDTGVVLEQKQLETGIVEKLRGDGIPVYQVKDRSKLASNPFLSWWFDIRKLIKAFRSYRPDLIVVSNGTPGIMLGALIFPLLFCLSCILILTSTRGQFDPFGECSVARQRTS